ncbi:MAG: glycosyltransferase family 2 protein, partial [Bacilli bacterium]
IEKKFKLINFSIIIPVYNSEKTIKRTIKSILNQNYKNYEIIIINDGCKDKSMKLINKYKFSKNVKIINQKNMGQSIARNNGIKNANGKYLIFLDSDDTFVKKTFSNLEIEVIKNQPDLIYSNIFNKISIETKKIDLNRSDDVAKNYILGSPCPYSKVFKKNIIEEFPKFDRYEDLAIIPLYILKTDKISKIDIAFYNYYKKEESIMHRNNKNFECLNESLLYLFEEIKKYDNFSIYRQEYEFLFIKNLLYFSLLRSYYTKEELKKYKIGLNMLKSNFPKWHENIYLKEQTKKFKKFVKLINLEKIEEAIKIFKTKGVKIK